MTGLPGRSHGLEAESVTGTKKHMSSTFLTFAHEQRNTYALLQYTAHRNEECSLPYSQQQNKDDQNNNSISSVSPFPLPFVSDLQIFAHPICYC
jgi:hypothetical protein